MSPAEDTLQELAVHYAEFGDKAGAAVIRRALVAVQSCWHCEVPSHRHCRAQDAAAAGPAASRGWTPVRRQVAHLIAAGYSNLEIADAMTMHQNSIKYQAGIIAQDTGVPCHTAASRARLVSRLCGLGFGPAVHPDIALGLELLARLRADLPELERLVAPGILRPWAA